MTTSNSPSLLSAGVRGQKRTSTPTFQAIDLTAFKQHARIDLADEDTLLLDYIQAATDYAEQYQQRAILSATWQTTYDYFPPCGVFYLLPPLSSVTSITYYDTAGVSQTLSASLYTVDTVSEPGRVAIAPQQQWPSTADRVGAVTVTHVSGYASALAIPARTRQAIRQLASHWYVHREIVVLGWEGNSRLGALPLAVVDLLDADKLVSYR